MTRALVAVAFVLIAPPQLFRSGTEAVEISASVKRGNVPVANLTAADFRVADNGVAQTVELLTIESVPLDVSLFLDTSGSTAAKHERFHRDADAIVAMLRPSDRVRALTIGVTVDEAVGWQPGGTSMQLRTHAVPGISLIYDALFAALMHRPAMGRRHLVVGLTDGHDCGSVIDGPSLLDASGRTEAVMHVIHAQGAAVMARNGVLAWCTPLDSGSMDYISKAAERTGGAVHWPIFRDSAVSQFHFILDDFRASYVLRYTPRGVAREGWHAVTVEVPGVHGATVRARPGYAVAK